MTCFALVVDDILVPNVIAPCDDPIRGRFESALVQQLALCCAKQTLISLIGSDEMELGDLVGILTRNLFALRLSPYVPTLPH
jgi:hypothetical protein